MPRWLLAAALFLGVILIAAIVGTWMLMRASLPTIDGTVQIDGLEASISLERDESGTVTVSGQSRPAVAYGLGYAHGQDRFFQMDLARRLAAGELSELFGPVALEQDRSARLFRFRRVARTVLAQIPSGQRAVIDAYVRGVNDGVSSLRSRPWEYWLLRSVPEPWRDEDTVLAVHAMWWQLQYSGFESEQRLLDVEEALRERLGPEHAATVRAFLFPAGSSWDAANPSLGDDGAASASPPIPTREEWSLQSAAADSQTAELADVTSERGVGSNNWALMGTRTSTGAALVANDMHLGLGVPPVWYRARLRVESESIELNGVTLAGAPVLVAGSNGHIAWGFTNSYGDWLDLRWTPCNPDAGSYLALDGRDAQFELDTTGIRIKGRKDRDPYDIVRGSEGVLFGYRERNGVAECQLASWLAAVPDATNLRMIDFERARTLDDALALAPEVGIPHQNVVIGDVNGRVAWTIIGRVPTDSGPLRALGQTFLDIATQPRVVDPSSGQVWTANARAVGGTAAAIIGGDEASTAAGYDLGARAAQIRDGLSALSDRKATPADMLAIQLDDRAVFLTRWRELALARLDAAALDGHPERAEFRRALETTADRAAADASGYRLLRAWHDDVAASTWRSILGSLGLRTGGYLIPPQFEGPLWSLVTSDAEHWLPAGHRTWNDFLLARIDATIDALSEACPKLDRCTWGARKAVRMRHPMSSAVPWLSRWLDMPIYRLAGDHDMPRVQDGAFGASERFAVSPGHEAEGYLEMPGGPSGHFLSPFYQGGVDDWAEGRATPFLPGPPAHKLTLTP